MAEIQRPDLVLVRGDRLEEVAGTAVASGKGALALAPSLSR